MHTAQLTVDWLFGIALFINAALFIPQIVRIIRQKSSRDVSLITFNGFLVMQILGILYGVLNGDLTLVVGYGVSLLTNFILVCVAFAYK